MFLPSRSGFILHCGGHFTTDPRTTAHPSNNLHRQNINITNTENIYDHINFATAFVNAVKMVALAGADVFNLHLGWKLYGGNRDIELASEVIKRLIEAAPENMYISLETTYIRKATRKLRRNKIYNRDRR